jgi:uncharacterized integral membrane protein (TIGR00698 family)
MNSAIDPQISRSWSSMEGVPDWVELPTPKKSAAVSGAPRANVGHRTLEWLGSSVSGVALAVALAWLADASATWFGTRVLGYATSPISGVPVAIVLGLIICNSFGVPAVFKAGLRLCATTLLRTAIVLLGLQLSLGEAAGIGWHALPVVALCVSGALLFVPWLGRRAGLPPRLAALIGVGTGICGVTAILATAPAISAEDDEVSYAVACVAIFGMTAMLLHPYLAHLMFPGDVRSAGIFLGTAIHDTSQVAGAGLTYAARYQVPDALNVATVTKLMRNVCIAGAIPFIAWRTAQTTGTARPSWKSVFPLFVLGFIAMIFVRSIGDRSPRAFGILEPSQWHHLLGASKSFLAASITVVMASVGLQTDFSRFKRLGLRPLMVGFAAACGVGLLSATTLMVMRRFFAP